MVKLKVLAVAALPLVASAIEVSSSSLAVTLDESKKGAVSRLVSAGGVELGATRGTVPLFSVELARVDNFTNAVTVTANDAKRFAAERDGCTVRLVYEDLGPALEKVVCSVAGDSSDAKVRWRISVTPRAGWAAVHIAYPSILCAEKIGSTVADDAVVAGNAKGGLVRGANKVYIKATMPGSLVAQFACLYDDSALFYFAAEDGKGYSKVLDVNRIWNGVRFQWTRRGFDDKTASQDYDVVTASIDGTAARPCMWHDAADLYRTWAERQSWCRIRYEDRTDIPAWMKDAPSMVRFNRDMISEPDLIRAWMRNYWKRYYPESPLVMAYWGWERHGNWVSDYFPVNPSNEAFAALVKDCKAMGGHAFPWPSGYYWILDYDKQPDGTFKFSDHAAYNAAHGDDYACITRDGRAFRNSPPWLRGGIRSCLCGGTQFCQDWWNKTVCLPLARLGVEIIQADQTVGGAFPSCWSRKHGHEFGEGLWKKECFYRQMVTMRETMRTCEPDSVVCFEEPCELYNDVVGIQDYRTCEARSDEWASVFNYIYHEYLPCFQSNPRRYDRVWQSHAAADGQMPFLTPSRSDLRTDFPALDDCGFERPDKDGKRFLAWEARPKHIIDRDVKHGGESSLRMEYAQFEGEANQCSQNIYVQGRSEFAPGTKLRLSAWLKSERGHAGCYIGWGTFTRAVKNLASGKALRFPAPEEGWKQVSGEMTMPKGEASFIRVMINATAKDARVWVDDMKFEAQQKDGSWKEVILSARGDYDTFMKQWITIYHGPARKWLAYGRQIRPPVVFVDSQPFSMTLYGGAKYEGTRPCVFHSAWVARDGKKALVFVNATNRWQKVRYLWNGSPASLVLKPDGIKIVEVD